MINCENCDKSISEAVLTLHLAYCERKFVKCQSCGKAFDRLRKEESNCDDCKPQIGELKKCSYCTLDIQDHHYVQHVDQCSNRTSVCELCSINIRLSFMEEHIQICQMLLQDDDEPQVEQESSEAQPKISDDSDSSFVAEIPVRSTRQSEKRNNLRNNQKRPGRQNLRSYRQFDD